MKRTLIAAAGLALFAACGVASAASWSIVVEPGVYGRVAIGGYAQAPVVYEDAPVVVGNDGDVTEVDDDDQAVQYAEPVYLWVPEYQRLHWDQYCDQYGARGVPVYFVQDGWYRDNVMGRRWTPEQRSWSRDQWVEQDRIARDRWEQVRRDRDHAQRQPDYRQPAQWQGARGSQWAPQPQPQPQQQWHDDRGHAPQQWSGTPGRAEPDRGHGDGAGHADGNFGRGANPQPVGAWQSGTPARGQPFYGSTQAAPSRGVYQPAQGRPVAQQAGDWARGGTHPVQPGFGSNSPAPAGGSHQATSPARPVQTSYDAGQGAGRNAPHDGGARAVSLARDDDRAQGNERGQYQAHAGGYQNR